MALIGGHLKYSEAAEVLGNIPGQSDIVEGTVVDINRKEGGSKNATWKAALYIPQHWVDQLRKVSAFVNEMDDKQQLYVSGAPRCG